jgi:hypothetical protein
MRLRLAILAALVGAAVADAAAARLTEPAVRAFVARQEAAWNARNAKAWAASFTPDARFVDQARGSDNSVVPYGESTLAQATAQAERFFARSRFRETTQIVRIEIAPDGRSARVLGYERTRVEEPARPPRTLCAETEARIVLQADRILSRGQTETSVRCNARPTSPAAAASAGGEGRAQAPGFAAAGAAVASFSARRAPARIEGRA